MNAPTRVTLRPTKRWVHLNLKDLVGYRDLIVFFAWRDIKVRYRQTILGGLWAIIQPLTTMIVMAIVFGRLAHIPSDGAPYPVFCLTGLIVWSFFAQGMTSASNSVLNNAQLVEKVYFPRLVIPIAASLAALLDFLLSFVLLLLIMLWYGFYPKIGAVLCVPIVFVVLLLSIGLGSGLAALTVRFRDFRHLVPFLTQIWLFATPVIYPMSLVPSRLRPLAGINPLSGLIESFRWALLGTTPAPLLVVLTSVFSSALLSIAGLIVFRQLERDFADVI